MWVNKDWPLKPRAFIINKTEQSNIYREVKTLNKLQLAVAILAFIFAASLIPMSKAKVKGKGVRVWRIITLTLLMVAAALAMFSPAFSGK
jgi:cytochrome bd-type quinol oxidase subunit 2